MLSLLCLTPQSAVARELSLLRAPVRSESLGGHVGRAFVTSGAGVVGAFSAGLALFTVESLAVIYLRNANLLSTTEDDQLLLEVMGASLMLGAAAGASLGVAWVGGLMKGQGGFDSALLGGFVGLMGSLVVTQQLRKSEAGLAWLAFTGLVLPAVCSAISYELGSNIRSASASLRHNQAAIAAPILLSWSDRF
ncbi:hypothetical protein NR798_20090 [Archangium gephyra]|uniref:hypothetical protein n=1 Tax=Archangium gephyra TaxID=48 RepID=UPI0035D3F8F2